MQAFELYKSALSKAAGDRGGHVIGRTSSGKPVYARHDAHASAYASFGSRDHADAARIHKQKHQQYGKKLDKLKRWAHEAPKEEAKEYGGKIRRAEAGYSLHGTAKASHDDKESALRRQGK